jgi:hypothetical protein
LSRALYLSNDGEDVRRALVGVGHVALYGRLAGFRELRASDLHAARFRSRQSRFSARGDQRAFFLRQCREQVENERVNVGAKLSDKERHAMRH